MIVYLSKHKKLKKNKKHLNVYKKTFKCLDSFQNEYVQSMIW